MLIFFNIGLVKIYMAKNDIMSTENMLQLVTKFIKKKIIIARKKIRA